VRVTKYLSATAVSFCRAMFGSPAAVECVPRMMAEIMEVLTPYRAPSVAVPTWNR
jgi:hypothetical protein